MSRILRRFCEHYARPAECQVLSVSCDGKTYTAAEWAAKMIADNDQRPIATNVRSTQPVGSVQA